MGGCVEVCQMLDVSSFGGENICLTDMFWWTVIGPKTRA